MTVDPAAVDQAMRYLWACLPMTQADRVRLSGKSYQNPVGLAHLEALTEWWHAACRYLDHPEHPDPRYTVPLPANPNVGAN